MNKTLLSIIVVSAGLAFCYLVLEDRETFSPSIFAEQSARNHSGPKYSGEFPSVAQGPMSMDTESGGKFRTPASSIYGATNLSNQGVLDIQVQGDLVYDALLLQSFGREICNYFTEIERANSQIQLASLAVADRFRSAYCTSGVDALVAHTIDPEIALRAAEKRGSHSAAAIIEVNNLIAKSEFDNVAVEGILVEIIDSAESPAALLAAAEVLLSLPASELLDPRLQVPSISNYDAAQYARLFGFQIAACRKFGICDVANVYSIRSCMPYSCAKSGSLYDYIESQLTPVQYAAALEFSRGFD